MPLLPFALAATYLIVNLALVVWIAREEIGGRTPSGWLWIVAKLVRWVPPLVGVFYLVTIAGDWPFFLFVAAFFVSAFWLLNGLLNFPSGRPKRR